METKRLEGSVAVITGAARGIGRSFAERYLDEGARVVIADINIELAQETADELGEHCTAMALDVTKQNSIDICVDEIVETHGKIDILINNAALFSAAPTVEITREDYDKLYAVNVSGSLFMLQAVARHMIERGEGGKIINMASQAGRRGEPLVAVYCSTKAAIISLTQSFGLDLIKYGINVNAISPGVVDGEHWDIVDSFFAKHENLQLGEKKQQVAAGVPFGRMGTAEDLTGMAVFLASSDSDYVVAQTYNVDGGQWMS